MSLEKDKQRHWAGRRNWLFWRGGIAVAVAMSLGVGIWWWLALRSPIYQGNIALKQAYRSQRPLEGRISGFDYAPWGQVRGEATSEVDDVARSRSERLLLDAAFNNPGPQTLHALGRLYLAEEKFKEAQEQFTLALQAAPNNAQLHNDQGVVLMEQSRANSADSQSGEEVEQLAIALEHFNKALELAPSLAEATFNRALLYQRMMLPRQAHDEWQQYLKSDRNSPWINDARRNLLQLEKLQIQSSHSSAHLLEDLLEARKRGDDEQSWKIVSGNRDRVGSAITRELLDHYLDYLNRSNLGEAKRFMETMFYIGDLEQRLTKDAFIRDLASFYQDLAAKRLRESLQARAWLKSGLEQLSLGKDVEKARALFSQAQQAFLQIGNKGEAAQAEFLLASCYRKPEDLNIRASIYDKLALVCSQAGYTWLLAQTLMAQAFVQSALANHSEAIKYGNQGLLLARASSDTNSSAKFLIQIAESYYNLGEYHRSLGLYNEGVALVNTHPSESWGRWAHAMSIGLPLNSLGRHQAAIVYQRESLRVAQETGSPTQICASYINLGLTYGFQRNYEEAIKNEQLAFNLAQTIPGGNSRLELLALASLKRGELYYQAGDLIKAISSFNDSIQLYEHVNTQQAFSYAGHKGRLIASLASQKVTTSDSQVTGTDGFSPELTAYETGISLEEQIKTVLRLFEDYRAKILEESSRNKFFDVEQNIYDISIDFWYVRKRQAEVAFDLAERCRARSLLDLLIAVPGNDRETRNSHSQDRQVALPLPLADIQSRLPKQTQIVQYAVLKERLLIWVVSPGKPLTVREQKISADELGRQVSAYTQLITKPPDGNVNAATDAARQLYSMLIEPIAPLLDPDKQICLVPDKILYQLPFSSLVSPVLGHYLIEDYTLIIAPSATMFVLSSESATAKENIKVEKLLSVGDPSFDRNIFPFPSLPSARMEAQKIAIYYHQSCVLIADQATKRRVIEELPRTNVLHLALHSSIDDRFPLRSKLLFAKPDKEGDRDEEDDGTLQAHEIYNLPLSQTRLVVLAACRSGVERYYGGEGMVGISRYFIARGVPLVVASFWNVDSVATTKLMISFHERRKLNRESASEALRQAQLSLLYGPDAPYRHPYYWASFASIGGHTNF